MGVGETDKARKHRVETGWFEQYAAADKSGIDIGCQHDPLNQTFRRWDVIFGDGDATYMAGVDDEQFWTVYCSHVLEHLECPLLALQNWYRITKPGGHLIVVVPHRDLYEKKESPPSNWNQEHKWFYLPDPLQPMPYRVLCLRTCILDAIPGANIVSYKILSDGFVATPASQHSVGEISIEAIVRKLS